MDIPQRVEVDISGLGLGDSLKVEDLNLPENIQVLTAEDEVIVHVAAPKAVVEEEAEDEEQAGEGAAEEHEASGGHEAE
ncbi:MAG TPA: 50S ribosomal protein L25, partial [Firmicutes bacterium]|nr:50S ribosomal protein L25 [Bacillota bacterium]